MNWPSNDAISAMIPLPEGYRAERLRRSDIPALIAAIAEWHPDISVGAASCYLREDFYWDKAFLDGEAAKDLLVILIKRADELAGIGLGSESRTPWRYMRGLVLSPRSIGAQNWQCARWRSGKTWRGQWGPVSSTASRP